MKLSDQIAAFLADQGLKRVFGIPGTDNLPLMEGLGSRGVEYILVSHESAAAFMADATAYLTGGLQACMATRGPGAANLLPGVASAHLDSSPVVAITGEVEMKRRERFSHQFLDLDAMYRPVTKGSYYLTPENVASVLPAAVSLALTEVSGVVRLGLAGAEASREAAGEMEAAKPVPVPPPDEAALEMLAQRISSAQRPFVLMGPELWRARETDAAIEVAERLGARVAVTARAKGVFPERHPSYCGVISVYQDSLVHAVIDRSDFVLVLGASGVEFFVDWTHVVPVGSVSAAPADPYFDGEIHVQGALGPVLSRLASLPAKEGWGEEVVQECRKEIIRLFEEQGASMRGLSPQRAATVLSEAMPEESIVTTDVGSHKLVMAQIWRTSGPGRFITSSGLSCMGGGVPAATAASLERPDTPVVAVVGDLGMLMSAGELATMSRAGATPLVVVFNDNTLASIQRKHEAARPEPWGLSTGKTDFAALAESLGVAGYRASSESEVGKAVDSWRSSGGPALLEIEVDYSHYRRMGY